MDLISIEQANRLFWLGRYTERVYTTLRMYFDRYDKMIDESSDSYKEFCNMVDIPDIYDSKEDFMKRYPFDDNNPDSIKSNLNRAYDNAIVLREMVGSEALSYIQLTIYSMNRAAQSHAPLIELQRVIDNILSFWAMADDSIDSEHVRNIIKSGKRIERIDLYARLGVPKNELYRAVCRMIPKLERSGLDYDKKKAEELKSLVESEETDYYRIVSLAETIYF